MAELITGIAKKPNVPVIAEDVETEVQLRLLKKTGCEPVQGYYFSRLLPVDDFEKNIIEKKHCADTRERSLSPSKESQEVYKHESIRDLFSE